MFFFSSSVMRLLGFFLLQYGLLVHGNRQLWRGVIVDQDVLDFRPFVILQTMSTINNVYCGMACDQTPGCLAFCYDDSTCTLTSLRVSPLYVTTSTSAKHSCFTSLEKDYIVGSSLVFHSYITNAALTSMPGLLVEGVHKECYACVFGSANPWLLFDLGEMKIIHEVRITTQEYVNTLDAPDGLQVKVGKNAPATPGDFSSYKLFGTLPNPAQPFITYSLKQKKGIKGRYLSLQEPSPSTVLTICHVFAI